MKHTKPNLKNIKAAIAALLLCLAAGGANAQTLVTPTTADNVWYNPTSSLWGLNTATMAYRSGSTATHYFFASAAFDGTNSYIYVTDPAIGATVSIGSIGAMAGVPDIIIANNNTGVGGYSVSTDYILAVAYAEAFTGRVRIDYYDVFDDGSTLSISVLGGGALVDNQPVSGSAVYSTVHLDVIAEYNNTGITGLPFCNKFVVTWDDVSGTPYPVTNVAFGDLNAQTIGGATTISGASGGFEPNVAAIMRKISGVPHYTAWITYVDPLETTLYLAEWDFTTGSAASPTITLDNGGASYEINNCRIDAFDNYTTAGTPANYKVVAEAENFSFQEEIRSYDNVLGAGSYYVSSQYIDLSGLPAPWYSAQPPAYSFMPAVAAGDNYTIFHQAVAPAYIAMFMEPIDLFTSAIPTGSPSNHTYWVNSDGSPLVTMTGYLPVNAVSTPPNDPTLATLYAYGYYNGSTFETDYKITSGSGYAFRQVPAAVANVQPQEWQVYPNPAASALTVNITGVAGGPAAWHILDMEGRRALQGSLPGNGAAQIDVSGLVPGTYGILLYRQGELCGERVFVKE